MPGSLCLETVGSVIASKSAPAGMRGAPHCMAGRLGGNLPPNYVMGGSGKIGQPAVFHASLTGNPGGAASMLEPPGRSCDTAPSMIPRLDQANRSYLQHVQRLRKYTLRLGLALGIGVLLFTN